MSSYEETSVVAAAVNGLHSDVNGEAESAKLKAGVSSALCNCLPLKKRKEKSHVTIVENFPSWFLYDVSAVCYE